MHKKPKCADCKKAVKRISGKEYYKKRKRTPEYLEYQKIYQKEYRSRQRIKKSIKQQRPTSMVGLFKELIRKHYQ